MKKEYIAPEMVVVEIENETMMLTVSAGGEEGPSYGGGATDMEADANRRRGTWGNLWN